MCNSSVLPSTPHPVSCKSLTAYRKVLPVRTKLGDRDGGLEVEVVQRDAQPEVGKDRMPICGWQARKL
jgi:hypothetical protein